MPARLVALDEGPDILIDQEMVVVGRHPSCDARLDSLRLSRHHCCLTQEHGEIIVRDLGSTNGIRINGERVKVGACGWETSCPSLTFATASMRARNRAHPFTHVPGSATCSPNTVDFDSSAEIDERRLAPTRPESPSSAANPTTFRLVNWTRSQPSNDFRWRPTVKVRSKALVGDAAPSPLTTEQPRGQARGGGQGRHLNAQPGVADDRLDQAWRVPKPPVQSIASQFREPCPKGVVSPVQ